MRLLLFAAKLGYQIRVFAEAAQRLGIDVQLVTDRCHILDDPWGDRAIPVRFEDPLGSLEGIHGPAEAIAAVADRPLYLAALTAQKLGLPFHSPESIRKSQNKHTARESFRNAGLLVPKFERFPVGQASRPVQVAYPCVLKPLALSGSRGVIRANTEAEFHQAWERIEKLLASGEIRERRDPADAFIQVEDYIPGREFAVEGLLTRGRLQVLAIFDKPDPLEGPFFEETIYVTPSSESPETQRRIVEAIERAIAALGLSNGPIHGECRVNDAGVWVLEVAGRPIGGLCARALSFNGRQPLEEVLLRAALGQPIEAKLDAGVSGVMMIPVPGAGVLAGVDRVEEAQRTPHVTELLITAKEGERLVPLPEGNSYPGFIFARAESTRDTLEALRQAHGKLNFRLLKTLN
ncbi:MAG: ATP-grasp domain-containing protein [Bryobacteraceae bacterium]|nr:ATP-grasp domain-containing protein [Bryobacteraceae bacterium]